ncbi:type I-F CRISPR-associated protein Csy2 [Rodentibacter caecimuris]|uniref:Type I-F CRISPR-associated protein Csy2 n=1 Tax=Rodentibacter caecimuris TaxID=1796644 RepID=A0ABX3KWT6_9PAST|nr:type I-F CRISPR-associated protein Csy2 [Rodentibacter heylii]
MSADFYLLFKHIKIQSANAISGPLSYGFPAISGFVGAIHALSRKLNGKVQLGGVIVACHNYDLQTYQSTPFSDHTFIQSRNPLKKNGETAPIIEEGKIHLDISLVVELTVSDITLHRLFENGRDEEKTQHFLTECKNLLLTQRIAGGTIFDVEETKLMYLNEEWKIKHDLLPSFVLMDAQSKLQEITQELQKELKQGDFVIRPAIPQATALDALIETATLHHIPNHSKAKSNEWQTYSVKQGRGWLVPIPIGYQAISPLFKTGQLRHCRTQDYPSQYVETLYSLGEWVLPINLPEDLSCCFWRYHAPQEGLYLISQGAQ